MTARPLASSPARRRARSKPLSFPSAMSMRTTSGRSSLARSSASAMLDAVPATVTPSRSRTRRAISTYALLSSTSRQRMSTEPALLTAALLTAGLAKRAQLCWLALRPPGPSRGVSSSGLRGRHADLGKFGMEVDLAKFELKHSCLPRLGPWHVPPGCLPWPAPACSAAGQVSANSITPQLAAFIRASLRSRWVLAPRPVFRLARIRFWCLPCGPTPSASAIVDIT